MRTVQICAAFSCLSCYWSSNFCWYTFLLLVHLFISTSDPPAGPPAFSPAGPPPEAPERLHWRTFFLPSCSFVLFIFYCLSKHAPPHPYPTGLRVPPSCELVVGGEPQCWSEGSCLLFDDSFLHRAFHEGEQHQTPPTHPPRAHTSLFGSLR